MSETVISIKDLSKSFGDHEVLRDVYKRQYQES